MPATLTLTNARAQVRQHLDAVDEDGTNDPRWSDAFIDRQLNIALDAFLSRYTKEGDDKLFEHVNATTAATGILDLSSYDPVDVEGVSIRTTNHVHPIMRTGVLDRGILAATAQDVTVRLLRRWTTNGASDPIFYSATGTAQTTDAHNELVCAYAARACGVKDDEQRAALEAFIAMLEQTCYQSQGATISAHPSGDGRSRYRYYYDHNAQELGLCWLAGTSY